MRGYRQIIGLLTLCYFFCAPAQASDAWDLINKFLNESAAKSDSDKAPTPERQPIKVAQHKSVLRLSDEKVSAAESDASLPKPVSTIGEEDYEKAKAEKKRIESGVDRKIASLERSLAREERRLEERLETLNKKREQALAKGDEKLLKQIESLEKKAVTDYERRIERLLVAAEPKATRSPVQNAVGRQQSRPQTSPSWNKSSGKTRASNQPTRPKPAPKPAPQKRRLRLWPFGR